jgi:hypothetical protein
VLDRGQLVHAVHGDEAGAAAGDPRAHLGQERDDVEDLGLLRGVVDHRPAGRQASRHDQVLGAGVRRRVQVQVRALQLAGLDPDGRVALVHDRAEPGEAAVVEVQVPVAQVAPADALDHGLAEPVQQGRDEQHRAAEPAGDLGRQHRAGQVGRVDDERPFGLVELDDRADRLGQFDGAADVLDRRDVPQHRMAVAGEQGCGDHLQRRVLRALHENRPVQRSASAHAVTRLGSQSHAR